jgi:hypothetical protein
MMFNTTFKHILVISWLSVLLVEETGVPRENHRPAARHWHLYHMFYRVHLARCSGRVGSFCSTSGTHHVNLVANPVITWVMNEERTGKCLRQVEHIRDHLWHRYSITVNQVMVSTVKSDDFNLTKRNPWFSSFLVSSSPLSRKSWYEPQAVECRINWEIYTSYAGAVEMLLHIYWKFTMGKLKSSLLS